MTSFGQCPINTSRATLAHPSSVEDKFLLIFMFLSSSCSDPSRAREDLAKNVRHDV